MTEPEDLSALREADLLDAMPERTPRRVLSLSRPALVVGAFGLMLSWLTPWAVPVGLVAVILATIALVRRQPSRDLATWGLWLGIGALACGGVWTIWIAGELALL